MFVLSADIKIGRYRFKQITNVRIERTSRLIADTAEVEMPLSFTLENKQRLTTEKAIKRGDKVLIQLGYGGNLETEFEGFVTEVKASRDKTVIKCEDNAFLLRKQVTNKAFGKTTLKQVLNYVASECGVQLNGQCADVQFERFVLRNVTGLQVIKKLKDTYGLSAFFDYDGKLYVGLAYSYNTGEVIYNLRKNVITDKTDLEFKVADDIKLKVRAVSILKDNTRLEVELGDDDGELRTLYFYNITSESELRQLAQQELERLKYTGYRGKIAALGEPWAAFGMTATVRDSNYPQREGKYYVESVRTDFGQNGFHRTVELGPKI